MSEVALGLLPKNIQSPPILLTSTERFSCTLGQKISLCSLTLIVPLSGLCVTGIFLVTLLALMVIYEVRG